jgi:hypothetical protein
VVVAALKAVVVVLVAALKAAVADVAALKAQAVVSPRLTIERLQSVNVQAGQAIWRKTLFIATLITQFSPPSIHIPFFMALLSTPFWRSEIRVSWYPPFTFL